MIDNKKIPTWLGVVIIVIFVITVGVMVSKYEKEATDMQTKNVAAVQPKKIETIQDQPNQEQQNNIKQTIQMPVAGVSNVERYFVNDFLKQNLSISVINMDLIKELTYYKKMAESNNEKYAQIEIVRDTLNKNIIYFIDGRFHFNHSLMKPDIYSLNLETNELINIYKAKDNSYDIELVGIKNNNLLFFKKGINDSPGPCFNYWVTAYEHPLPRSKNLPAYFQGDLMTIKSINLNNIKAGFSNFTVPKEKYISELALQKKCSKEFNKEKK
ncbi:MAG: hypothetical protein WC823_05680 [Parcubacteria group bacterium]|jgi:hypothetical protein